MADPQTFEDLTNGIQDDLEDFLGQLNSQIQRIAKMLNDAANGIGGFIADIFSDTVDNAIKKWNEEIHPWILKTWDTIVTNVWDAVGDLAGRPLSLIDYADAYSTVKAQIYKEGDLTQKMVIFDHDWKGYAAENYKAIATTEDNALRDLSLALDAGAVLTSNAAAKILTLWKDLASKFLGWTADLIGCFSKATEADAIVSFEIPAAFDLAKIIWQNVVDLAELLVTFMIDQATTASTSWQQLASGARGLPQNKWPMVEEGNSDAMNDPGNWEPQSA